MKRIQATDDLVIELYPTTEVDRPLLVLTSTDAPDQTVIGCLEEARHVAAAPTDADVERAEMEVET